MDHDLEVEFKVTAAGSLQDRQLQKATRALLALPPCGHGSSAEAAAAIEAAHFASRVLTVLRAAQDVAMDQYAKAKADLRANAGIKPLERLPALIVPPVFTLGQPAELRPETTIDDGVEIGSEKDPFYSVPAGEHIESDSSDETGPVEGDQ